jgi:hypothetical protein
MKRFSKAFDLKMQRLGYLLLADMIVVFPFVAMVGFVGD